MEHSLKHNARTQRYALGLSASLHAVRCNTVLKNL
jgi:hypothetical protein